MNWWWISEPWIWNSSRFVRAIFCLWMLCEANMKDEYFDTATKLSHETKAKLGTEISFNAR